MVQWLFTSQKAAKPHDCYKSNISMLQESRHTPGSSSRDMVHRNAIDARKSGTRRTHARNRESVPSVLK